MFFACYILFRQVFCQERLKEKNKCSIIKTNQAEPKNKIEFKLSEIEL